ncbi:MAG: LysR substrate-binding domain-containing protein [Pseudomonadota bacterium]
MKIEELELFRRAAALGALSAAGRALGLSPAAASARLQSLERSLGVTLFSRTTRRLALTEEGEILLGHATRALEELEAARVAVAGADARPAGVLRASIPGPFGRQHVLPFLPEFLDRHPDVELDLHISDEIVNVIDGGYEMVVRVAPLTDSALLAVKLAPNRRIVCAAPAYLERYGAPAEPEDLIGHRCLIFGDLRVWRFHRGEGAKREERAVRVTGPLHTNNGAVTGDAARFGLGIALKSIWDIGEDLKSGRLVQILDRWRVGDAGDVWALRPPSRFPPPRVKAFIAFLKEKYGPTPYWEIEEL